MGPLWQVPVNNGNYTDQDYLEAFINKINSIANGGNTLLDDFWEEGLYMRPVSFEIQIGGLRYSGSIVDPSNRDPLGRLYGNPSSLQSDGSVLPVTFTLDTGSTVKIWIYFQKTTIN